MNHTQTPVALTGLSLLVVLSLGCAGGTTPGVPAEDDNIPNDSATIDDEPYIREITGITEGTANINGAVVIEVGYENQPAIRTMDAAQGELIFFRQRPHMSDGSTNLNNASSYAGLTNDYGYSITNAYEESTFEVRYALASEPISLSLWNADVPNGELHNPAVLWDYTIKTAPAQGSEEPNSDNNTNTVYDRTMATPLKLNVLYNRSMFAYSLDQLDTEEWWKVELTARSWYSIDVGTYHPRYGTWKYRLHVRNPNGAINAAGLSYLEPESRTGQLVFQAEETGTHFIQMAGYRRTRTESGNVFFSPYSLIVSPTVAP